MRQIFAIALNTFREATRSRVFFSLIAFAIAMLLLTMAVSSASLHEEVRLMKDMGLFLTSTFSVLIAVFVGVNLVYKEIERKTVYTVMPKPIYRFQFLLGKYAGLAMTMAVQLVVMGVVLFLQFKLLDAEFGLEMVQALWLLYVEVLVVTAIAMVFSSFSTPFLSGILTIGTFVVGRFVDQLLTMQLVKEGDETAFTDGLTEVLRWTAQVAPDLTQFNSTPYVVYEMGIEWSLVGSATAYGFTYAAICLVLAAVLFSFRDFV